MYTILLLEDDEADAFLIQRALDGVAKQCAITISVTHRMDGIEGLAALREHELPNDIPDTIVLDLNMPRMDGMHFLRSLRSDPTYKYLHAAVLTTSTEKTMHALALSAGADRVFIKPSSIREMATLASEILRGGEARGPLHA
jgi:CheY-like chemotaxis protein